MGRMVLVLWVALALIPAPALACVGDLVLPKPQSSAQTYAFAAGQILGRAEACGIRTERFQNRAELEIYRLARGHTDRSCAFFGFDHFWANMMYYQELHARPNCEIVRQLFDATEWTLPGITDSQKRFKDATAKDILRSSIAGSRS